MKTTLSWALTGLLCLTAPGCIFVHVKGNPAHMWDEEWDDDEGAGYRELEQAVAGSLTDPKYDLDLVASPWRTEAEWTVRYASAGSNGHDAFQKARAAVLARIARKGGTVTGEKSGGPHDWTCTFRLDDEPGKASVRLVEDAGEDERRPHRLEITWEESN